MSESHPQNRPIIFVVVSPSFIDDWENLQRALDLLSQQDQGMRITTEPTERRVIISGMGELHLEVISDRLIREFKIPLDVGKPEVIYRETIRRYSEAEAKYIRQVGGRGQYAHVKLGLEPGQPESGYQFIDESPDNAIPRQFVESIDSGIQGAMKTCVLAGNEIVDVRAVLRDGSYHVEDSNEMAFKIAGCMAFKDAARKAEPVLLEPVMAVEVVTPEDYAGVIMGDLSSRRGRIEGMEHRAGSQVIKAIVPLAEMFGYATHMRSSTQGRAEYSMHFARYEEAPNNGKSGADEIGVTANKPKGPRPKSGFAAAQPDELSE
jgi:elongation factor G